MPREITVGTGETVTIFGQFACRHGVSPANRVVRLFHNLRGIAGGFTYVQMTRTDATGFYKFENADGGVETNRVWHVRARGAESENRGVRVIAHVTLEGPPEHSQLLTGQGNEVKFTGSVTPVDAGARVVLQRQSATGGTEWHGIGLARVEPNGTFTIIHDFLIPGEADIRVLVLSQGRNIPSPSNVIPYEISQAQNPALTIASSADPIDSGQSVTISGTLKGGASQSVSLLAHTVGQPGYAQVAQVNTNASGEYAFPAQSPLNSTFYQVQSASERSAVLFESVKYVLTAAVSTTSLREGQTATFSGSVAPAPSRPGHLVYLERRSTTSGEFHIVRVGVLSVASTFAIPYQPYTTGTLVFRVHVPGGPANGSASSAPLTIQVTPAPAASLIGEAPGNTSLPSEGSTKGGHETPSSEGGEAGEGAAGGKAGSGGKAEGIEGPRGSHGGRR